MSGSLTSLTPINALTATLAAESIDADLVDAGNPRTGYLPLAQLDSAEIGIWEMTEGIARDIEVDEVFVVLEGDATVDATGPNGSRTRLHLTAGVVCQLRAGTSTRWTVERRLRKIFIGGSPSRALSEGS